MPVDEEVQSWFEHHIEEIVINEFRRMDGRLKTFVEAITGDEGQCKARKDVAKGLVWKGKDNLISMIIGAHNDTKE